MIGNTKKFQTIVITKRNLQNTPATLSISNMTIKSKDSVELLGVTIDKKLTFEKYKLNNIKFVDLVAAN